MLNKEPFVFCVGKSTVEYYSENDKTTSYEVVVVFQVVAPRGVEPLSPP